MTLIDKLRYKVIFIMLPLFLVKWGLNLVVVDLIDDNTNCNITLLQSLHLKLDGHW